MKKYFLLTIILSCIFSGKILAQRKCGLEAEQAALITLHPEFRQQLDKNRASLQNIADGFKNKPAGDIERITSATCAIPVIFHIIVTESQLAALGDTAGIIQRCESQIQVLNRDFNGEDADSVLIPSGWTSLHAHTGIHFALACIDTNGHSTPGFEILVTNKQFISGSYGDYSGAKYADSGGLSAWNNKQYINVWCLQFSDNTGLLGLTTPKSYTISGGFIIPDNEMGICILYNSLGKRASSSDSYPCGYNCYEFDEGKTLVHEMGHFFEIWHTWGNDGGLCPWNGGTDDGLADTPPQGNSTSGNPTYTIPGGTLNDACEYDGSVLEQPYGYPCLDYMDYTDDAGMLLFTTDQAAVMDSMVAPGGESYTLTQQCGLGGYTGIKSVPLNNYLNIYPNPTNGLFNISYNSRNSVLKSISVLNVLGEQLLNLEAGSINYGNITIDLSRFSKGIYIVKCNFAEGTETRKLLLQ